MEESRNQPIIESCQSALHERNSGGAREHRELQIREVGDVAKDAAEQPDAYPKAHKACASLVPPLALYGRFSRIPTVLPPRLHNRRE
jgi:hypothetical protein